MHIFSQYVPPSVFFGQGEYGESVVLVQGASQPSSTVQLSPISYLFSIFLLSNVYIYKKASITIYSPYTVFAFSLGHHSYRLSQF